jgi:dipeptidyl aminopeptidase/acylaminoacyl peptidase
MRAFVFLLALLTGAPAFAQTPIPIEVFASDPGFSGARLSPDGRYVVAISSTRTTDSLVRVDWRSRQVVGLQQVQRGEAANQIDWVEWKSNDRLILSVSTTRPYTHREVRGAHIRSAEEYSLRIGRVISINADGSNLRAMFEGQRHSLAYDAASTALVDPLPADPDHVLITAWGQNGLGLYRANVNTGRTSRIEDSGWYGAGWGLDGQGVAVLRFESLRGDAGHRIFVRAPGASRWSLLREVRGGGEINSPDFAYVAPGPESGQVWVSARPEGHDKAGLYLFDSRTETYGEAHYEHPAADFVGDVWITRNNERLLAACARHQRRECRYFDDEIGRHMRAIDGFFEGGADVTLVDMSEDGAVWLVHVQGPTTPPGYYIYDQARRAVLPVSAAHWGIDEERMSPMQVVTYRGRDGADLWGYLTTPRGGPAGNAPLVVYPHGGPESRDVFAFNRMVQFLASRGYMVFQPQFRGSGGFGRQFAEAGRRQWGQRMQDDVTDGVQHLIAAGLVDPSRICIVGGSYGGYAALAGAALTPDLYRCAVSINGVSDLREMLRWEALEGGRLSAALDYWRRSIGHPSDDRAMIDAASPRQQVSSIRAPIFLIAAAQDGIVPVEQSRAMRDVLNRAGKDVRYLEVPREGHSLFQWRMERRVQALTELESFLAANLH